MPPLKLIAFNGSTRLNGNTRILLETVCAAAGRNCDYEIITLAALQMEHCRGCFACAGQARCPVYDDDFNTCLEKMCVADGILLGSPVYSADLSARMKILPARAGVVAATNPGLLRHKAGAAVAAVRRAGDLTAVDAMTRFFLSKEIFVAGATYWNMVYGKEVGDVRTDEEGMRNMQNLGENLSMLMQMLHTARGNGTAAPNN